LLFSGDRAIPEAANTPQLRLRILATSDLHMQLTGFDYVRAEEGAGGSLAQLATLINAARDEATRQNATCLLLDNGDTYQGTPVADVIAREQNGFAHPLAAAMNSLQFDAVGLGNHDFDHGLDHLANCLNQQAMPVVCSNIQTDLLPKVSPFCILDRKLNAPDGTHVPVRIGVLSTLPEKTALWSKYHFENRATLQAPMTALREGVSALRDQGVDVVVVLAHMGISLFDEGPEAQNLVKEVAALENVDVVIGGHTHLRFPGPDHTGLEGVDAKAGKIAGKPVVLPGASASDLGVCDLVLQKSGDATSWQVTGSTVCLMPVTRQTPKDKKIVKLARPAHERTRRYLAEPVAGIAKPMHSFFALADPSPLPALLAQAKLLTIHQAVQDTDHAALPLLAAASAPLTGGLDGPGNFLHLEKGALLRRHIAGMNPYANNVWAVKTTGAQVLDWLERSAMIFNTLEPDQPDQPLIDARVPGFRYDAIYGLHYDIDPREHARFDPSGRSTGHGGRITNVRWQGKPLDPEQEFLVATTDHRAGGGGLYEPFSNSDIVVRGSAPLQEAVLHYFEAPDCRAVRSAKPWSFVPKLDRQAILLTSPHARNYLHEIRHLSPEVCGETPEGFLRLRLHL
jgi:2',3'-cyclic-nucleotide 2'-phosphodiesterase/3'-nucleotidase